MPDPNGSIGDDVRQADAIVVEKPASDSGPASFAGVSWLLVDEYDLMGLGMGLVSDEVQAQARRLREELTVKLQRNAERPITGRTKKQ